jgi:hypothetical protein
LRVGSILQGGDDETPAFDPDQVLYLPKFAQAANEGVAFAML